MHFVVLNVLFSAETSMMLQLIHISLCCIVSHVCCVMRKRSFLVYIVVSTTAVIASMHSKYVCKNCLQSS